MDVFQAFQAAPVNTGAPRSTGPGAQEREDPVPNALLIVALVLDRLRDLTLQSRIDLVKVATGTPGVEVKGLHEFLPVGLLVLIRRDRGERSLRYRLVALRGKNS
jgi:hypothetical protein